MVGEQAAGEPQLGVGGDDEPGPAVGLLGQTHPGVVQPRVFMATMRNIAISLLRLAGWTNIKRATEKMSRSLGQTLALVGVQPGRAERRRSQHRDFGEGPG